MVNRSQGAGNRPRSGSSVAQLWRSKLPAIVAKHSTVDANPRHRLVAIAMARSRDHEKMNAIVWPQRLRRAELPASACRRDRPWLPPQSSCCMRAQPRL
jgi:hypothetical protein